MKRGFNINWYLDFNSYNMFYKSKIELYKMSLKLEISSSFYLSGYISAFISLENITENFQQKEMMLATKESIVIIKVQLFVVYEAGEGVIYIY